MTQILRPSVDTAVQFVRPSTSLIGVGKLLGTSRNCISYISSQNILYYAHDNNNCWLYRKLELYHLYAVCTPIISIILLVQMHPDTLAVVRFHQLFTDWRNSLPCQDLLQCYGTARSARSLWRLLITLLQIDGGTLSLSCCRKSRLLY